MPFHAVLSKMIWDLGSFTLVLDKFLIEKQGKAENASSKMNLKCEAAAL